MKQLTYCIFSIFRQNRLTARVTGGWGEKGPETGNCHSSEKAPKNAQTPSRPVHAVLGGIWKEYTPIAFMFINHLSTFLAWQRPKVNPVLRPKTHTITYYH